MSTTETEKVKEARKDVKADPSDANAQYNLGLSLMKSVEQQLRSNSLTAAQQKVVAESEGAFKQALRLTDNTHGRAAIMLGMLYQFQGAFEDGIPYAMIGLQLPTDSYDYAIAADVATVCLESSGKRDEALEVLTEALKHHPDNAQLQKYNQILSAQQVQDTPASMDDKQKKAMEMAGQLQKEMERIMNSAEPAEVQQKKLEKAQADYQKKVQALYGQ